MTKPLFASLMIQQMAICVCACVFMHNHTCKHLYIFIYIYEIICALVFVNNRVCICKLPPTAIYCSADTLWLWWVVVKCSAYVYDRLQSLWNSQTHGGNEQMQLVLFLRWCITVKRQSVFECFSASQESLKQWNASHTPFDWFTINTALSLQFHITIPCQLCAAVCLPCCTRPRVCGWFTLWCSKLGEELHW